MRWFILAAISCCVLIASVSIVYRAMSGPRRAFTSVPTTAPTFPIAARAEVSEEDPVLSEELREAIRANQPAVSAARAVRPEPSHAAAPRSTDIDDLAQQLAPALAREAVDLSAQKSPVMPEVEHELLETWKEQKQILAGQRETIDTVLNEAH